MRESLSDPRPLLYALPLGLALHAVWPAPALAERVGTAAAVNTISTGTPPGQRLHTIEIGAQVVRDETINTSKSGSVQVVFIDRTTLNIGRNSTLVIDEFVFSPADATGKVALSLVKGALRVVGGQATHTGGALVRTPVATIGVRGGIATIEYCPADATAPTCPTPGLLVTNHFGQVTVTALNGGAQTISRPGFSVAVAASGRMSDPFRAVQARVDATNALLTSKGRQTGGSTIIPTDTQAGTEGLGRAEAGVVPSASTPRQAGIVAIGQDQDPDAPTTGPLSNVFGTSTSVAQSVGSAAAKGARRHPRIPVLSATAFALTTSVDRAHLGQSQVPYLLADVAGQGTWKVSRILGYRAGGKEPNLDTNTTSRVLQAGLNITGVGRRQSAGLFVMTGGIYHDDKYGFTLAGGFEATDRNAGGAFPNGATGVISSDPNTKSPRSGSVPTDTNLLPTGPFSTSQNGFATDNSAGVHDYLQYSATTTLGEGYDYNQTVKSTPTPSGLGSDHPNETLNGYVGGTMQTIRQTPIGQDGDAATPTFVVTNASGSPGDVSITLLGKSSRFGARFNVVNSTPSKGDGFRSGTFNFGYLKSNDNGARGTYVNSRTFAALSEQRFIAKDGAASVSETSLVNGRNAIQGGNDDLQLMMVSSDTVLGTSATVHTSKLFPGVTFCSCDYTRWGFWAARSYQQDSGETTAGNLMFWVAGLRAGAADIPKLGSATYDGHVVASISNNGAQYVSASNFSNKVNFGRDTGTVAVANLDGIRYAGTIDLNGGNRALFGGTIAGQGGHAMTLDGTFFKSAALPYGEMGGSVSLSGNNYLGGGIFVAHAR